MLYCSENVALVIFKQFTKKKNNVIRHHHERKKNPQETLNYITSFNHSSGYYSKNSY